jgi:hypothetical protein
VCVLKKMSGVIAKSIKLFSAKKSQKKVFGGKKVKDFFTNFKNKKILKFLENYFLDFSFSKKQ